MLYGVPDFTPFTLTGEMHKAATVLNFCTETTTLIHWFIQRIYVAPPMETNCSSFTTTSTRKPSASLCTFYGHTMQLCQRPFLSSISNGWKNVIPNRPTRLVLASIHTSPLEFLLTSASVFARMSFAPSWKVTSSTLSMISWINEIQRANYQVSVVMYCVKTIKKDTIQNTGT